MYIGDSTKHHSSQVKSPLITLFTNIDHCCMFDSQENSFFSPRFPGAKGAVRERLGEGSERPAGGASCAGGERAAAHGGFLGCFGHGAWVADPLKYRGNPTNFGGL